MPLYLNPNTRFSRSHTSRIASIVSSLSVGVCTCETCAIVNATMLSPARSLKRVCTDGATRAILHEIRADDTEGFRHQWTITIICNGMIAEAEKDLPFASPCLRVVGIL